MILYLKHNVVMKLEKSLIIKFDEVFMKVSSKL